MNLAEFHFLRPYWLLAIALLFIALWLLKQLRVSQSGWSKLIPQHLSKVLLEQQQTTRSLSLVTPFLIGLIAILALAGPTWQKLPQPVYQVKRGSVVVMDMSYSMYATDLSPNRLTRARYKAMDLLDKINEGDIGLIAYAGDAFVISPLTQDINNIKLLLPSLSPELMPELGSNPLAALHLANDMLANAGHIEGDIYWFTDGIDYEDVQDINDWSNSFPHKLNILGVGTTDGAPITLPNGELMKDNSGAIILPKLSTSFLSGIAQTSAGVYQNIHHSNADIENLVTRISSEEQQKSETNSNTGDQWLETGPYLVLLLLPLLLGYFRRGLLTVAVAVFMFQPSTPAYAKETSSIWESIWNTPDQQGQQAFDNKDYNKAAESFQRPDWQGSAHYKAGNFEQALTAFKKGNDAKAFYNQGNTLAQLGRLDESLEAYQQALTLNPDFEDAKKNKTIIETLKEQQDKQKQEQPGDQDQQSEQNKDNQNNNQSDNNQEDQNQSNSQEQQPPSDKEQSSNNDNQQSDEPSSDNAQQSPSDDNQQDRQSDEQSSSSEQNNERVNNENSEPEKTPEQDDKQASTEENSAQEPDNIEPLSASERARQEQIEQEKAQKYKQLMNKVTDDPHRLLREKMRLEAQKRRRNGDHLGEKKKW